MPPRILVLCDLEGAAGVVDFKLQTYADARYYDQAKRLATLEINALVDGILDSGPAQVVVLDGHGPGGLDYETLHRDARMMVGRPLPLPWIDASYEAQFLYGHHAMNHVGTGVLCHSWSSTSISNCWLNGELIGEIGMNCALASEVGVPTVFISGDDATIEEGKRYVPEVVGVSVKEGLSRTAAISLSPFKARDLMREGGRLAMAKIDQVTHYSPAPPYTFRTEYIGAETAAARAKKPGIEQVSSHAVEVKAESLLEIMQQR